MFYSEHGQDRWLAENVFGQRRAGVFVEFGALDGIYHSNTLYFERELGWSGLLIEANPEICPALAASDRTAQKLHAAIADKPGTLRFAISAVPGWSGLRDYIEPEHRERMADFGVRHVEVPAMTLANALDLAAIKRIDYMSIDVEGAEAAILSVFPFDQYGVDVFGVENNWGGTAVGEIMTAHGYAKIGRVGVDDFYRRP